MWAGLTEQWVLSEVREGGGVGGVTWDVNLQPPQIHIGAELVHGSLGGLKEDSLSQLHPQEPVWGLGCDL